jgi:hypothetical protein
MSAVAVNERRNGWNENLIRTTYLRSKEEKPKEKGYRFPGKTLYKLIRARFAHSLIYEFFSLLLKFWLMKERRKQSISHNVIGYSIGRTCAEHKKKITGKHGK